MFEYFVWGKSNGYSFVVRQVYMWGLIMIVRGSFCRDASYNPNYINVIKLGTYPGKELIFTGMR